MRTGRFFSFLLKLNRFLYIKKLRLHLLLLNESKQVNQTEVTKPSLPPQIFNGKLAELLVLTMKAISDDLTITAHVAYKQYSII